MRIAALSDIHYDRQSRGKWVELFKAVSDNADVFLMCGDLTDYGLEEEAKLLADDLHAHLRVPALAVLGNHDFESGTPEIVRKVMDEVGVTMLNGESKEIDGVGFAGTCGFSGGFDEYSLNPWGEKVMKDFVQTTVDEALKLETALSRLETDCRIVLLHYSPIRSTVVGESPEIFPFLGSSRLEDPLNHYKVTAAFHGHAHRGAHQGMTSGNVPVFNVSIPVLKKEHPDQPPFKLFEIAAGKPTPSSTR